MNQTRSEWLAFEVTLDKAGAEKHASDIKEVMGTTYDFTNMGENDDFKVNYGVFCEYFGSVERKLRALQRILPSALTSKVAETQYGESIIVGIVNALRDIRAEAEKLVGMVQATMGLEGQAVDETVKEQMILKTMEELREQG